VSDKPDLEQMRFSDALSELESVVAALESGKLDLEESLEKYEYGVSLMRTLQSKLADAQQRVTMLVGELEHENED